MRHLAVVGLLLLAAPGCAWMERTIGPLDEEPAPREPTQAELDRARANAAYREGIRLMNPPAGVTADPDRAARLIEEAATLGHAEAQMLVAASYLYRPGGARDPAAAIPWLERAARQGHVEAQLQLARLIEAGDGAPREPAWAAVWFQRAAERGSAEAQYALALMQIAGTGTAPDQAEALARLTIAERGGVEAAARYRDALAVRIPPEAAAEALARIERQRVRGGVPAVDRPLVRFAQSTLLLVGLDPGPVDGLDGPSTRAALAAFARNEGVSASGPYAPAMVERLRAKAR
jgi:hypothetical protein